jgi:hypothetical protein
MALTSIRDIELIDIGSLAKESITNTGLENLARGVSGYRSVTVTGLTTLTLQSASEDLSLYSVLAFAGSLAANCLITAPRRSRLYVLDNRTTGAGTLSITTGAGNTLSLPQSARTMAYCDGTNLLTVGGTGSGGGTSVVASASGQWSWTTATSGAPSTGQTGINTTGVTVATELRMHATGSDGVDRSALLDTLQSGDLLYLQDRDTSANFVRYRLTADGVKNVTWWSFAVAWDSNGGSVFPNNQTLVVVFSLAASIQSATTTQPGIVQLADSPTTLAGTNGTMAVTPAGLQATINALPAAPVQATVSTVGITRYATVAESTAGTLSTAAVTPNGLEARVAAIPVGSTSAVGLVELATNAEAITGTDTMRVISAAAMQAKLDTLGLSTSPTFTDVNITHRLGIISAWASNIALRVTGALASGNTAEYGAAIQPTFNSSVTANGYGLRIDLYTQAAAFTLAAMTGLSVGSPTLGAGSTIGAYTAIDMLGDTVSGTSYGLRGQLAAGTNRWNLYLDGTANNYVNGSLGIGTTTFGTSAGRVLALALGTAPTTSPADSVQLWAADRGAVVGKGSLHLRTEDGTSHVFGDRVGIGTLTPISMLDIGMPHSILFTAHIGSDTQSTFAVTTAHASNTSVLGLERARGTHAAMTSTLAEDLLGLIQFVGYTDTRIPSVQIRAYAEAGYGTTGTDGPGRLSVHTVPDGSNVPIERLRIESSGNVGIGATTFGTSAVRVLALASGIAPTTSPVDMVQIWSADRAATAGKASLHLRTEDGTSHVLGDLVGLGTLLTATLGSGAAYQAHNVKGSTLLVGQSSVQERPQALLAPSWVVSTDATRTARLTLSAYDATAAREGLRLETSGTAALLGFFGQAAVVRQTVPAAATDAATVQTLVNALRTALVNLGLCV